MSVDAFRDRADRFIAELDEETYLHYSGQKSTYEVEAVYERFEDLTTVDTALAMRDEPTELWRFACEGFLGNLTRAHQARVMETEAKLEVTLDGEVVPYRMLRPAIQNEPDRDKRRQLEQERVRLMDEHMNPIYLEAARIDREAVQQLGAANYYELYKGFGFRLDELADECRTVLAETERLWEREGDKLFRARLGIGLDEARPWDVGRLFRAPELDSFFPEARMLPALESTLSDLGVDLKSQHNVHLDLESRPQKVPRPFCMPIEVPGRVILMMQPVGGRDDWEALFHEAGHTQHFAHTSADLPLEEKRLGDMALTEGWASLFDHLPSDAAWLNRRLDVPRVSDLVHEGAVASAFYVRRYSAKLLYEIEFFQADDPASMQDRYFELLSDALKLPVNRESYLDDIDGGFYVTGYLRSWAFEAQLSDYLRDEFGREWFARGEAGELLRELWSLGQGPTADSLLKDVTGARLEMAAVVDRIGSGLAA